MKKNQETAGGHVALECQRLHAAYEAVRVSGDRAGYRALMQAIEDDLRDDAFVYTPVAATEIQEMRAGRAVKWVVLNAPMGRFLCVFTSRKQAERHSPCEASVGVRLSACFRALLGPTPYAGFVLNADDGRHGIPVDRGALERIFLRAKDAQVDADSAVSLNPAVVAEATFRLFSVAADLPAPAYDIAADLELAGGAAVVLDPVLAKWEQSLRDGSYTPANPAEYVRSVVVDAMARAFVAGVLVRRDPQLIKTADAKECLGRVPDMEKNLNRNADAYLVLLSDLVRRGLGREATEDVAPILALHAGIVAAGAMKFGFGWGVAKYVQTQRPEDLEDFAEEQQAALKRMRAD